MSRRNVREKRFEQSIEAIADASTVFDYFKSTIDANVCSVLMDPLSAYQHLEKNIVEGMGITGGLREQMDFVTLLIGHRLSQSVSLEEQERIFVILQELSNYCKSQQPQIVLTMEEMRFLLLPLLYKNGNGEMTKFLDLLRSMCCQKDVLLVIFVNSSLVHPSSTS